jgi:ubiquinone/menaquinone biosynthesis C-methylase UbiE
MTEKLSAAAAHVRDEVADVLAHWLKGVVQTDFHEVADTHLSLKHVEEKLQVIERYLPGFMKPGIKILEVGSGFGAFTVFSRALHGYDTTGVEPDPSVRNIALKLAEKSGVDCPIADCPGEALSFADESFDLVYSSNVLEHVQDPARVLSESVRVLKPGGYLFFTYPNYCSFWEGHYGMFWIPCMNKPVSKVYVRLFGRYAGYIDGLQLMNVKFTRRILNPLLNQVDVLGLGDDLWVERMRTLKFGAWGQSSKLKRVLSLIQKIPFLVDLGILIGRRMNWYYPIIVVLRKKQNASSAD